MYSVGQKYIGVPCGELNSQALVNLWLTLTRHNQRKSETMDSLIKRLSQAATKEEKLALLAAKAVTFGPSIQTGPPRIMTTGQRDYMKDFILDGRDPNDMELVYALAKKYDLEAELVSEVSAKLLSGILPEEDSWTGPIKFVPCANVYPEIHEKCPNVGTRACANCRLALYCSTVRSLSSLSIP